MEFDNKLPIYLQIINEIKRNIIIGELELGSKLPSVREMSVKYKVNPNTIQRVYSEMEREQITYTKRGKGTFITEDEDNIKRIREEISEEIIIAYITGMRNIGLSNEQMIYVLNEWFEREDN